MIEDMVRGMLMGGDTPGPQTSVLDRLSPQPLALFTTPVDTKPFAALTTPKTVIFGTDDTSLPPGVFLGMAQGLGEFDLIEIPTGHEGLVVSPGVVAEALLDAVGTESGSETSDHGAPGPLVMRGPGPPTTPESGPRSAPHHEIHLVIQQLHRINLSDQSGDRTFVGVGGR